jgi:hypothetical protein
MPAWDRRKKTKHLTKKETRKKNTVLFTPSEKANIIERCKTEDLEDVQKSFAGRRIHTRSLRRWKKLDEDGEQQKEPGPGRKKALANVDLLQDKLVDFQLTTGSAPTKRNFKACLEAARAQEQTAQGSNAAVKTVSRSTEYKIKKKQE